MTEGPRIRLRLSGDRPRPDVPSALDTYRALRESGGEDGKRVKRVLERLRDNPGRVRGDSLRYRPDGWLVLVEMTDKSICWIIWHQPADGLVDILWIGPEPDPGALAYSTETGCS